MHAYMPIAHWHTFVLVVENVVMVGMCHAVVADDEAGIGLSVSGSVGVCGAHVGLGCG